MSLKYWANGTKWRERGKKKRGGGGGVGNFPGPPQFTCIVKKSVTIKDTTLKVFNQHH